MAKINICVKGVFIFFNVIYAILGCVLIYGVIQSSIDRAQLSEFGAPSVDWMWAIAFGIFGISCLGIYAAWSEKALFLKTFAGCMGVGMVIMLIFGIVTAVARNKAKDSIDSTYLEDEEQRKMVIALQEAAQCCGISSASDWGNNIPQSCACNKTSGYSPPSAQCIDKPQGTTGPNKIWGQGCKDFIFFIQDLIFSIFLGVYFGFAVTALLGLLITLLMIHQVNQHDGEGGPKIFM
ncbi:tetraspanin-15-like [Cheilinus undulatus]|uniref:tetraspanin-15-like n=1 Tax=Cheilinus undulatus TaxID=241271 RepID=UPI001BD5E395|nr:tetraspanin-15-like [Cheilinus undulatus]